MQTQPQSQCAREAGQIADAELVRRFQRGDRAAFAALVRQWDGSVVRIAFRITGDLGEAEEVRQEVFLRLLESPHSLREPERFAAWIRRCATNTAIEAVRKHKLRQRANTRIQQHLSKTDDTQPIDKLAAADEAECLRAALAKLETDERGLLALRFDEGLTFQEIGNTLERPVSTVKSQVASAVERLRGLLGVTKK